jgi:hypothetical protein
MPLLFTREQRLRAAEAKHKAESAKSMTTEQMNKAAEVPVRKTEAGKLDPDMSKGLNPKIEKALAESEAFGTSPKKEKEY